MKYVEERRMLIDYGKKMLSTGLTQGTGGNLSCFLRDQQLMLITPSGIPYEQLAPNDIVMMDLNGKIVDSVREPSSEYHLHLIFYQNRQDVAAVVHTHSEYAMVLACLHQDILPLHYLIGSVGKRIRCCGYETFGTEALAQEAYRVIGNDHGLLLGNHGALAVGETIDEAFEVADKIEFLAKLYYRAKAIGQPVLLSDEQMDEVLEKFETYGQHSSN